MYEEFELNDDYDYNLNEEKKSWHLYCICKTKDYHDDDTNDGHDAR